MLGFLRSLKKNRRLLTDLVGRDLRARYVGSSMGFFWSVIFPIVNLVVYMFVFSVVLDARWGPNQAKEETALLMLAGIIVWQAFAESMSRMTNTLVENQNLIQKVVFPSEVLPPYLVLSSLINMLIGTAITLLGVAWFAYLHPIVYDPATPPEHVLALSWSLCSLPVLMLLQALFTVGLGYLFSALNLFLRDIYHVMGVALQVWMFLTPIFYPAKKVSEAGMTWVLEYNPMYWLVDSYRNALLYGIWPKLPIVARFGAVALLAFVLGSVFFMRQKPRFPDLL
ncbi:MAG: ABC transporter permease [Planctomycetes bacterium]|nr:ABC transporter permease [Planctomycetota bacterium]